MTPENTSAPTAKARKAPAVPASAQPARDQTRRAKSAPKITAAKTKTAATQKSKTANKASSTKTRSTPATRTEVKASATKPAATKPEPKRAKAGYEYEVAFSFAGEDRAVVQSVNAQLQRSHITTFYDFDHQVKLVGENLFDLLSDLYQNKARFCAIFISKHYVEKNWTNLERQAAQARAFTDREAYILPFRLDNTAVPGILNTVGYVNVEGKSARDIARIIRLKVKEARLQDEKKRAKLTARASAKGASVKGASVKGATTKSASATGAISASRSLPKAVQSGASTKSSGQTAAPMVGAPGNFHYAGKISASGTWLLLGNEFYRASSVKTQAGVLAVEIKISARQADQEKRLDDLDPKRQSGASHRPISYAHGNKAFKVIVDSVESHASGGSTTFQIKLRPLQSSASSGLSWGDNAVENEARSILLGERDESARPPALAGSYGMVVEGRSAGALGREGVFQALWKRMQGRRMKGADVLRCARLEALYQLKSSGTVEHVSHLALGPARQGVLGVSFEGQHLKPYSTPDVVTVRFIGKCRLSS